DLPLWHQFLIYAWKVLHGDFGMSILTARPVLEDLIRVFPATAELATVGIIIGVVLGIPLGVWSAVYRNSFLDHVMRVLGLVGYSVPIFWLGIMGCSSSIWSCNGSADPAASTSISTARCRR